MDLMVLSETQKKGKNKEIIGEYLYFWNCVPKSSRAKVRVSIITNKNSRRKLLFGNLLKKDC